MTCLSVRFGLMEICRIRAIMLILLYLLETLPRHQSPRRPFTCWAAPSFWVDSCTASVLLHDISMPLRIGGTALTLFPLMGAAILLLTLVV